MKKVLLVIMFYAVTIVGYSQSVRVDILGGDRVYNGDEIILDSGGSFSFRVRNDDPINCAVLWLRSVGITNTANFKMNPSSVGIHLLKNTNENCGSGWGTTYFDFSVSSISGNSFGEQATEVVFNDFFTGEVFKFSIKIMTKPIISVYGGENKNFITNGQTETSTADATHFGVAATNAEVVRTFYVSNTGNSNLKITDITSDSENFKIVLKSGLGDAIGFGGLWVFDIIATADDLGERGDISSVISIISNDSSASSYTFNVSADIFNFNDFDPDSGVEDFRVWLKAGRGVTKTESNKVMHWEDRGTNGTDAMQDDDNLRPTFIDSVGFNINFNPVVKFENSDEVEQYLHSGNNGFYSQEIFIVMEPDQTYSGASNGATIFAGNAAGGRRPIGQGDITGVGFGDYSRKFSGESITYGHGVEARDDFYGAAVTGNSSFSKAGIINVRNNDADNPSAQEIVYNGQQLSVSEFGSGNFKNVGDYSEGIVLGSEFWIGKNGSSKGSLNGRVAEILTFSKRIDDDLRSKIESYFAIKYGITLCDGDEGMAVKDYINSHGRVYWDVSENSGFNYNVAGIGRDDLGDLHQKQSKSINDFRDVTISLGSLEETNSKNINGFTKDLDFLAWGSNNDPFSQSGKACDVDLGGGIVSSVTRIGRTWKVVESGWIFYEDDSFIESTETIENVYVSIPEKTLSDNLSLISDEDDYKYVLIVSEDSEFSNVQDVIPLSSDGKGNLQTWYDFDDTKFFTFGKATKENVVKNSVNIAAGDFLVGEYNLSLSEGKYTASAWVRNLGKDKGGYRTIMSKGEALQLRLNEANQIEVVLGGGNVATYTSNMVLDCEKWHHVALVYNRGTAFVYVDGVLDKSMGDLAPLSTNSSRYAIGAVVELEHEAKNHFLGEMDEVQFWSLALSQEQIRFLMNQEIENEGGYVKGKVSLKNLMDNEGEKIDWSKLIVYYNFNSFCGTSVEGVADGGYFMRINYLGSVTDKQIALAQTTPLPYVTVKDGFWRDSEIWDNHSVQHLPNSQSISGSWSSEEWIDWNIVEMNHNITTVYGEYDDIYLQYLKIAENKEFTISGVTEESSGEATGNGLLISGGLVLEGVLNLEGASQLIQGDDSDVKWLNNGGVYRSQQGTANSFNYNYWSSPVSATGSETVNQPYSLEDVLYVEDGAVSFSPSRTGADKAGSADGATISTYWMYKYYRDEYFDNAWKSIDEKTLLLSGEGYTMKGTSGSTEIDELQNYVFKGVPHNGEIVLELENKEGSVERLIGNPYPSAIDGRIFIEDNISKIMSSGSQFNGTLYFWDHIGEQDSHRSSEFMGGYATLNLLDAAPAISSDDKIDNSKGKTPSQYIAVGQGFFVISEYGANIDSSSETIGANSIGEMVFRNSQRVFQTEKLGESSFFTVPSSDGNNSVVKQVSADSRPKIRLKLDSPKGYHRQIVLGVDKRASNDFNVGFDAYMADSGEEDLFWIIADSQFVIQGVSNLDETQEFPLGLRVAEKGMVNIEILSLENLEEGFDVFIKDKQTGKTHDITNMSFQEVIEPGEYLDRFLLVFQDNTLGVEDEYLDKDLKIFSDMQASQLRVEVLNGANVSKVDLYNVSGQLVSSWKANLNAKSLYLPVNVSTGVYFVQVHANDRIYRKKVIFI